MQTKMKRQLLCLFAALLCVVSASAVSVGSYIYTPSAKFKVTGDNIVTNGNFASGTDNWTTTANGTVDATKWTVVTGKGPNGENVLESQSIDGSELARSVALEAGKVYTVSYSIYATSAFNTSVTPATTDYIGFYANTDGAYGTASAGYRLINESTGIKANQWKTVNDTITTLYAQNLQMVFQNIAVGTQITNVEVQEVNTVYDDRIAQRAIDYAEYLLNLDQWAKYNTSKVTNGYDDFKGVIDNIKGTMKDPSMADDEAGMTGTIAALKEAQTNFLDQNSADMSSLFSPWTNGTKYQKATQIGDWVLTGGRWYHCNNVYTDEEKARIYSTYQYGYDLPYATATLTKTMKAGRYMFAVDMKGTYMAGSKDLQYVQNYDSQFYGAKIFADNDTTVCDTLPTRYYATYTKFFDAPEGENNLNVGAIYELPSDMVGKTVGGTFSLANAQLRLLGTNAQDQARLNGIDAIMNAQHALKVMIDSAIAVKPKAEYPWGKVVLQDSINLATPVYNTSISGVIDANGNVLDESKLKDENDLYTSTPAYTSILTAQMKNIRTAIQNYYALNAPYTTLVADLAAAKQSYNDTSLDGDDGLKTKLKTAMDIADALISAVTSTTDSLSFAQCDDALQAAKAHYLASTATFATPATIDLTNPFFTSNTKGWTLTETTAGKETFKSTADANFDNGHRAGVWRGYTASPKSKLKQAITLNEPGIYEYRASAYACNDGDKGKAYDMYMATITTGSDGVTSDTTYNKSEVKLFFGSTGVPDSVRVHSRNIAWSGSKAVNGYIPSKYSVFYYVSADQTPEVEVGMSSYGQVDKQGANMYGFGDNYVYYYGNKPDKYMTGAKSDLKTEITTAETLISDTLTNKELVAAGRVYIVNRLAKAIAAATATAAKTAASTDITAVLALAKETSNAKWTMLAAEKDLNSVITGVKGVFSDETTTVRPKAKGVFTISGVKIASDSQNIDSLPKGIYIIDGQKVAK